MMNIKYLSLTAVPQSLRKRIFEHYHYRPTDGHMGEYKTLYHMISRFYWPKTCNDIKTWVQSCAHCTAYNAWINRKSELYFSWTITTPIRIMHINLWCPGQILYSTGNKGYLINVMCNLTKFVISTPTYNITAENLANLFIEEIFFNFGTR